MWALQPPIQTSATLHSMGEHLIVLCHGLNGDYRELSYLERAINEFPGCRVLNSRENDGGIFPFLLISHLNASVLLGFLYTSFA